MQNFQKGSIVRVTVTGMESYGVFVTCDEYYTGLIHISEISDDFVRDISDYVGLGDVIFAKVIDADPNLGQLKLSIKNIDYKHKKSGRKRKLKETKLGFKTLEYYLPIWIDESLQKIENCIDK